MNIKDYIVVITALFAAFFVMEDRHASSTGITDTNGRVAKLEMSFDEWDNKEKIRKYEERIEGIEGDFKGKPIPLEWLNQIEWLQKQIDELKNGGNNA